MAKKVKVVPTEGNEGLCGVIDHPSDGPLSRDGSWWGEDHFTFTMIRDGIIKLVNDAEKKQVADVGPEAVFAKGRRG